MTDALSHRLENEPLFTLADLRQYADAIASDGSSAPYVMQQARQRALEIIRAGGLKRVKT